MSIAVVVPAAGAGTGRAAAAPEATTIVATNTIWADITAQLACGGDVGVVSLIPPGGDPHAYEPSLADRGRLDDAALVVANGLGLEAGLDDTLDATADGGTPILRIGEFVDTIEFAAGHDDEAHDHDEDHGDHEGADPHVWLDPTRVSAALPALAAALVDHVGLDPGAVEDCLADYQRRLALLDAELVGIAAQVPVTQRVLVTGHDSLGYFADRYGYTIVGTVVPGGSTLAEANPAALDALARVIESTGVPAVFADTQGVGDDTDALAQRVGVAVVPLFTGTLGPEGSGADSYIGLLRTDATRIADALVHTPPGADPAGGSGSIAEPVAGGGRAVTADGSRPFAVVTDPYGWWVEPFVDNGYMRSALFASLLAVLATSVVGTWVVLRGMSFLGDALAHGVLPGIAVAFVAGFDTTLGALVAALAMVGGISLLRERSPLPEDTSIGVLFVGFLALAVVIMSSGSASYSGDLNGFLFGSITGVSDADLVRQALAAAVTVGGVTVFHRAFLVMTFDETQARLLGMRPRLAHAVLLGLLAASIVTSFQAVGNLLVFAFLIAPPSAASLLVRRVPRIMAMAVLLGAVSAVVGLLISYWHETAAGATMALAAVVVFLAVVVVRAASGGGPGQRS